MFLCFANSQDRGLVFDQRPWYVNGLNFVLIPWIPFFDPYNTLITRVDQWIQIPRLPWEFWDAAYLYDLLKNIGPVVRLFLLLDCVVVLQMLQFISWL